MNSYTLRFFCSIANSRFQLKFEYLKITFSRFFNHFRSFFYNMVIIIIYVYKKKTNKLQSGNNGIRVYELSIANYP